MELVSIIKSLSHHLEGLTDQIADLPFLVYRIEQLVSMVKSIVLVPSDGQKNEPQNGSVLDISAWAPSKQ